MKLSPRCPRSRLPAFAGSRWTTETLTSACIPNCSCCARRLKSRTDDGLFPWYARAFRAYCTRYLYGLRYALSIFVHPSTLIVGAPVKHARWPKPHETTLSRGYCGTREIYSFSLFSLSLPLSSVFPWEPFSILVRQAVATFTEITAYYIVIKELLIASISSLIKAPSLQHLVRSCFVTNLKVFTLLLFSAKWK